MMGEKYIITPLTFIRTSSVIVTAQEHVTHLSVCHMYDIIFPCMATMYQVFPGRNPQPQIINKHSRLGTPEAAAFSATYLVCTLG